MLPCLDLTTLRNPDPDTTWVQRKFGSKRNLSRRLNTEFDRIRIQILQKWILHKINRIRQKRIVLIIRPYCKEWEMWMFYSYIRVYSYFLHELNANNNLLFHLIAQSTTTWACLVILECYNEMLMFLTQKAMITNSINRIKPALFWTTVWILFIPNLYIYIYKSLHPLLHWQIKQYQPLN